MNCDVYKNEKLIIKDDGFRIVLDKENDAFLLQGQARMTADGIIWPDKKLPSNPKKQPYEIWENAKSIVTNVSGFNGKSAEGFMNIRFSKDGKDAKLSTKITADGSIYVVEMNKVTSISGAQITATFHIICDNKMIAENVSGKITGIDGKLKDTVLFQTDDGAWSLDMLIVEIAQ